MVTPAGKLQTFGFNTRRTSPFLPVLQLLYSSPRVFQPLTAAWLDRRGLSALNQLVAEDLVRCQKPVIMDVRTQSPAGRCSKKVTRWRATASGRRLLEAVLADDRVLSDTFPLLDGNQSDVVTLLDALAMPEQHVGYGISVSHLSRLVSLDSRHVRWWLHHLHTKGYATTLPDKIADARVVVPAHWRATAGLTRQIQAVIKAFPATAPTTDIDRMQIHRRDFLPDIVPTRVGLSGATDYDHDVSVQTLLGHVLGRPHGVSVASVRTEPRYVLPADTSAYPWIATSGEDPRVVYQPDAVFSSSGPGSGLFLVEYERFQSRRDGWIHLERFIAARNLLFGTHDKVVLAFVLDSQPRERGYIDLTEAFATWINDYPEYLPMGHTELWVSSLPRLLAAADPLHEDLWARVRLETGSGWEMCLHTAEDSPYSEFF